MFQRRIRPPHERWLDTSSAALSAFACIAVLSAPFIADPLSVQQGYVTSEPFAIEREGGFDELGEAPVIKGAQGGGARGAQGAQQAGETIAGDAGADEA